MEDVIDFLKKLSVVELQNATLYSKKKAIKKTLTTLPTPRARKNYLKQLGIRFDDKKQIFSGGASTDVELKYLLCPITKMIFIEPVIAKNGVTYEKSALMQRAARYNHQQPHFIPNNILDDTIFRLRSKSMSDEKLKLFFERNWNNRLSSKSNFPLTAGGRDDDAKARRRQLNNMYEKYYEILQTINSKRSSRRKSKRSKRKSKRSKRKSRRRSTSRRRRSRSRSTSRRRRRRSTSRRRRSRSRSTSRRRRRRSSTKVDNMTPSEYRKYFEKMYSKRVSPRRAMTSRFYSTSSGTGLSMATYARAAKDDATKNSATNTLYTTTRDNNNDDARDNDDNNTVAPAPPRPASPASDLPAPPPSPPPEPLTEDEPGARDRGVTPAISSESAARALRPTRSWWARARPRAPTRFMRLPELPGVVFAREDEPGARDRGVRLPELPGWVAVREDAVDEIRRRFDDPDTWSFNDSRDNDDDMTAVEARRSLKIVLILSLILILGRQLFIRMDLRTYMQNVIESLGTTDAYFAGAVGSVVAATELDASSFGQNYSESPTRISLTSTGQSIPYLERTGLDLDEAGHAFWNPRD